MALADTARLVASLELQDKFSKTLGNADRGLSGFDRRLKSSERVAQGVSRGIGTAVKVGFGIAAVGVGVLAVNIKKGVDSLNELENVTTATNTVIKSTRGIAGQTADEIREMSESFEDLNATMDDKVIQSGANLLLTFTNIRKDAFEPALEAALNLNEGMGGGPEGLQSTIVQVGKALNDPIKGVTALRRVGVQLSEQQEDQIKTLVDQNDLYGAQQIILGELTTQFGGRFAAAGKTAEGRMAALSDRVEDLQKKLAGPLIPVIDRVREKLIDFLGSKTALRAAETLGDAIANLFTDERIEQGVVFLEDSLDTITSFLEGGKKDGGGLTNIASNIGSIATTVGGLPWAAIGDAARLLGTGSKALLDAFLGLPPWVQTAVLTGWGLNKLTGGALGGIVGELGKGLIKGVLGMNAGVVNINAATVNGGTGGAPTSGGSRLAGAVGTAGIAAAIAGGFSKLNTQEETITVGLRDGDISKLAEAVDFSPGALIGRATQDLLVGIGVIPATIEKGDKLQTERLEEGNRYADTLNANTRTIADRARQQRIEGNRYVQRLTSIVATSKDQRTQQTRLEEGNRYATQLNRDINANASADAGRIDALRASHNVAVGTLAQIRDKPSSFTTNVTVNNDLEVGISATGIAATLTRIALTTNQQQHTVPTVQ